MNALTQAAISNVETGSKRTKIQNYVIAIVCGIALGVMLGLGV